MADDAQSNKDDPDLMSPKDLPDDEITRLQQDLAKDNKKDER